MKIKIELEIDSDLFVKLAKVTNNPESYIIDLIKNSINSKVDIVEKPKPVTDASTPINSKSVDTELVEDIELTKMLRDKKINIGTF